MMILYLQKKLLTFSFSPVQQTHEQKQHVWCFSHLFCHLSVTIWLTEPADLSPRQDVQFCISESMNAAIPIAEKVSADNTDHNIAVINLHIW